ncbi:Rossmann-like and DUF2520 domain-containing protein [Trichloromonas sp.]|uniref:Rossmann-like and DUF2520 domain-containing protein n=1 Tax=Trichloromonas sp. TaxID=3069249 RepID=UPI003D81AC2E
MKPKIVLIGPGRLGQAVTSLLAEAGYPVVAVISRDPARAVAAARFVGHRAAGTCDLSRTKEGDLVLLALPDDFLADAALLLRRNGWLAPNAVVVHFSGRHPAAILNQGEAPRVRALSLHPLQTFADSVTGLRNLPGTPFSVEGEEALIPLGETLVDALRGKPFRIDSARKPLYHAAACVASNYLITLAATAAEIMAASGIPEDEALTMLLPLLKGTSRNLSTLGPEQALTGPIARGDVQTVASHLDAMAELPNELREIYRVMGRKTVGLARQKGTLGEQQAEAILELLKS